MPRMKLKPRQIDNQMSTQRTSYTNYESGFDYSINEEKVSVRIRRKESRFLQS